MNDQLPDHAALVGLIATCHRAVILCLYLSQSPQLDRITLYIKQKLRTLGKFFDEMVTSTYSTLAVLCGVELLNMTVLPG